MTRALVAIKCYWERNECLYINICKYFGSNEQVWVIFTQIDAVGRGGEIKL